MAQSLLLVDAFGRPIHPRHLPDGIDLYWSLPDVEQLSAWDVAAARSAAESHELGDFTISGRMFWAMQTDPRIRDGLSKRSLALRGMKWRIEPGKGQAAKTVAKKFEEAWPMIRPPEVAAEIHGQALLMGLGTAQNEWGYAADHYQQSELTGMVAPQFPDDGWFYPRLRPWEPTSSRWLPWYVGPSNGQLVALARGSERGQWTPSYVPINAGTGQWVVYRLHGDRRPWRFGLLRAIWRPWISRLMDLLLHLRFNDVHGMPIREVQVPMGMRKTDEVQTYYKDIKKIGRDATLLSPERDDGKVRVRMNLIEAKSESWKSMSQKFQDQGKEITIALTGGTQNTEATGGNYKGAEEQREIRWEVKAWDAEADAECVNQQIAIPFATLNGYSPEEAPRLVYDTRPPVNRVAEGRASQEEFKGMQEAAKARQLLASQGVDVPLEDLLISRGIHLPSSAKRVPVQPDPGDPQDAQE